MDDERESISIRDRLSILRRRWWVILGIAVITAAIGAAQSLSQSKTYSATALLRVHDPAEDFPAAGLPQGVSSEQPSQIIAQAAQTADRPDVLRRVKANLKLSEPLSKLQSAIVGSADPTNGLVDITATAKTGTQAAALANAAAYAVATLTNGSTQRNYTRIADKLRQEVSRLAKKAPTKVANLSSTQRDAYANNLREQQVLGQQAARLTALSAVTQPVRVSELASVPASSENSSAVRNGVIGLIVGLVIGLVVALIAEREDPRLHKALDAEELLGWTHLGALPQGVLGTTPLEGGNKESEVSTMEALRMIRNNLMFLSTDEQPRSVLVTSSVESEGKSTVAIGIALASAAAGLRTLLVEADLHRPTHAKRLNIERGPGLTDYLKGEAGPQDILQTVRFVDPAITRRSGRSEATNGYGSAQPESTLVCITAGDHASLAGDILGQPRFTDFIAEVSSVYDLVVIDSAPLLAVAETVQIVPSVACIAFCVRMDLTTEDQAIAGRETLTRAPAKPTGLVLTDVAASERRYGYYSYAYAYRYGSQSQEESKV